MFRHRTGYQVIYGVWEIADTTNSFYQAIDVDFGNDGTVRTDETPAVVFRMEHHAERPDYGE